MAEMGQSGSGATAPSLFWYDVVPLEALNPDLGTVHPGAIKARPALRDNIAEYGMVNPLIIWNWDRTKFYANMFIGTGNNRYHAIKELGWKEVPCIVQGNKPSEDAVEIPLELLDGYFKDGHPIIREGDGRLRLADMTLPQHFQFPIGETNGKSEER